MNAGLTMNTVPPGGAAHEHGAARPGEAGVAVRTANAGYGLTSMRERLRMLDGALDSRLHGRQWAVTARLPLPGTAQPRAHRPRTAQPGGTHSPGPHSPQEAGPGKS